MTIKTNVFWNRVLSDIEVARRDNKIEEMVAAGVTDGIIHEEPTEIANHTGTGMRREWTTIEAANEWIAFVNTFAPPPVNTGVSTS